MSRAPETWVKCFDVAPIVDPLSRQASSRAQMELAHFALDSSGHLSSAARYNALLEYLIEYQLMKRFPVLRGEKRRMQAVFA